MADTLAWISAVWAEVFLAKKWVRGWVENGVKCPEGRNSIDIFSGLRITKIKVIILTFNICSQI